MKNSTIVAFAVLCLLLLFRNCGNTKQRVIETRDTVIVTRIDTVSLTNVVYRDRWRVRTDTVTLHKDGDTVRIPIPIDRYLFTDDTTYRAEISGFNVSLDSMEIYHHTREHTVTIDRIIKPKPKRWGLGVQAGYGINTNGQLRPYIGVGVSFNIARW